MGVDREKTNIVFFSFKLNKKEEKTKKVEKVYVSVYPFMIFVLFCFHFHIEDMYNQRIKENIH